MGIRLALIPRYALDSEVVERQNARLEHIARLVGMPLLACFVQVGRRFPVFFHIHDLRDVFQSPFACPRLAVVAEIPVGEDVRKFPFERAAVDPRLGCRAADGVADDADRHLQRIGQDTPHVVGDGREIPDVFRRCAFPNGFFQVFQLIHRVANGCWPVVIVGAVERRHVAEVQQSARRRLREKGDIFFCRRTSSELKFHVRLA